MAHQIVDAVVADFGVHGFGCLNHWIPELLGILESGSSRFPTIHGKRSAVRLWEVRSRLVRS